MSVGLLDHAPENEGKVVRIDNAPESMDQAYALLGLCASRMADIQQERARAKAEEQALAAARRAEDVKNKFASLTNGLARPRRPK